MIKRLDRILKKEEPLILETVDIQMTIFADFFCHELLFALGSTLMTISENEHLTEEDKSTLS